MFEFEFSSPTIMLFILSAFIIYWLAYGRFKRLKLLSKPSETIFLGNILDLKANNYHLHLLLHNYCQNYDGDVYQFLYQGHKPIVITNEEIIKEILHEQANKFQNRKFFIDLPWPCHDMITMLKDEKWKYVRGLLSPVFTPHSLKMLSPLLVRSADTYIAKLEEATKTTNTIDVVNHSQGFVMEALVAILFSLDVPNQSDFNKALIKLVTDIIQPPTWINWFCLLPYGNKLVKYIPSVYQNKLQPFIDTALGIVTQRRNDENGGHSDLLDTLLAIQKSGADKDGNILQDGDILAQGIVVLTAVHVATSFTLALATYHIAKDEHIQKKCQEEIDSLALEDDFPSWQHLNNELTYIEHVIKETMRLYPSAFMLMRECTEDCTIKDIPFEKGSAIIIPTYSIHRDAKIWKDPDNFNPDRFSETKPGSFQYLPFGEGPHMCLGYRMAIIEMKLVLANMLRHYEISHDEPEQIIGIQSHVSVQAMLSISEPINIKVAKRLKNV